MSLRNDYYFDRSTSYFMASGLNPSQQKAVNTLSGPLLVLAGAGSGKTRVVTYRIAKLIGSGIRPGRILAVTFTNKAAKEMQQRTRELLGGKVREKPEISTFHSLCVRVLRRNIHHLGYPKQFAIYDRGDQESVARAALREVKIANESLRPGDLLSLISGWKCGSIRPAQAASMARTDKEHLGAVAYRRYQNTLQTAGALDFDDLLLCTEDLFSQFAEVRSEEASRFDHLLIDEYQDTNASQYRIIKALAAGHRNLCVVGDDDQSIYGWRGAEVTHILRFHHDWSGATVVRLEENYRCTGEILKIANRLISFNKLRHDKVLRPARGPGEKPRILQFPDESAEAKEIVEEIARSLRVDKKEPSDFAILFRTNEQPRAFETELRRLDIPYVLVGGMSFFDRKEVRDIFSYIKVLVNPNDEVSLLRVINNPPRGIGQSSVKALMKEAVSRGEPIWNVLKSMQGTGLSSAAENAVTKFRQQIESFQAQLKKESPLEVVRGLIASIQYRREISRLYKDVDEQEARWQAVEEVVNALAAYQTRTKSMDLHQFLEEIALNGREEGSNKDKQLKRNAVALMTLHAAKGLEFPDVYLVGMEEGILPHHRSIAGEDAAIDEERRLCYVGITRAQDRLALSLALTRMKWGKPRDTIPSRFLYELTGQADHPNAIAARKKAAQAAAQKKRARTRKPGSVGKRR